MKLKYYTDPGHGWIAIKRAILDQLSIANKITHYSYQRGNTVYLEEDHDANILMTELKKRQILVEFQTKHTDNRSPIRNYQNYTL